MDAIESSAAAELSRHGLGSSSPAARREGKRSPRSYSYRAGRFEQQEQQEQQEQRVQQHIQQQQASGRRQSGTQSVEADARRFYEMLEGESPRRRASGAGASSLPPPPQQRPSPRSPVSRNTEVLLPLDAREVALERVRGRARAVRSEVAAERSAAEDRRRRNEGAAFLNPKMAEYRVNSRSKREHEAECEKVEELVAAQDRAVDAMILRGMFLPQRSVGVPRRSLCSRDLDREAERIVSRNENPERLGFVSCCYSR